MFFLYADCFYSSMPQLFAYLFSFRIRVFLFVFNLGHINFSEWMIVQFFSPKIEKKIYIWRNFFGYSLVYNFIVCVYLFAWISCLAGWSFQDESFSWWSSFGSYSFLRKTDDLVYSISQTTRRMGPSCSGKKNVHV